MIRKATMKDIDKIENILYDAVTWLNEKGIPNQWTYENTRWEALKNNYSIDDFYLYMLDDSPVGCVALTKEEKLYWSDRETENALYFHKFAVKREAAGRGISREMIDHAKEVAKEYRIPKVRLECNAKRDKLRSIYEREGFQCVDTIEVGNGYPMALYELQLLKQS